MNADAAGPDERLLDLVGAALKRFGAGIRLRYATDRAECVLAFPADTNTIQTSHKQPESQTCPS